MNRDGTVTLSDTQRERYARHLSLSEIGEEGQKKLLQAKVLVVGAGGLGSPSALYLAAAGIGTLGLADGDTVDLSNLQRQILHTTASVGTPKVSSAAERLRALNPDTRLTLHPFRLGRGNAVELVARYDFIIDATDSFETKFLIANACAQTGKPYSHAGITGFYGEVMTVSPGSTACYGCVFHEHGAAENATPEGPLGVLPGVIGAIQATETIKCLLSIGQPLFDTVLTYDALAMSIRKITVRRDPHCPVCGKSGEGKQAP
jgi:molybdopterin/thiamine biosynthesis adenylyltransferase